MTVVWTAPGSGQTGLYVAQEAGLWRDQGLDVDFRHIAGTSVVISAMMAGEVQLATPDPASVVQANLGGADVVMIAGLSNNLPFSIISQPSIQSPDTLRGKTMGISRLGASTHTAARVALRQWGLSPDGDVVWRQLGDMPSILAALQSGQIDAGAISPPTSTRAKQAGLHELIDLGKTGPEFPTSAIGGPRGWIQTNEEAVRRFIRGYALAVRRFKADKPYTLEVYRQYLQVDDPALLDEVYTLATDTVSTVPYVSADGYARLIEEVSIESPTVRERDTAAWLDMRYVRELDASGFFAENAAH
jgi:NitT/TauT family transport system substrate-binding protein